MTSIVFGVASGLRNPSCTTANMPRHRIIPRLLVVDEPLPWDVFDANGALLLRRGYRIARASQRDVLLARGLYTEEDLANAPLATPQRSLSVLNTQDPFHLWDSVLDELEILLREIRSTEDFREQIEGLASLIQSLARNAADTALAAVILTNQYRYPIIHSLHVAVLIELVATRLQWSEDRRISAVCAALTQNLAMLNLQMRLCEQRMAPTEAQRQEIQRHPKLGHDMLQAAGVRDPLWLRTVLEHHETPGGGGYPFGISDPCEEAILLQTADIFSAKVSPRAARKPITPQEAAKSLYLASGGGERNPFVAVLIKEIGIFPPGTFVRLANGELALVTHRGASANTPEALALTTPMGMPYASPMPRQTTLRSHAIVAVIPRDQLNFEVNISRIWPSD